MKRAQKRDAVTSQKFYFRKGLVTCNTPPDSKKVACCLAPSEDIVEMTIEEVINGKGDDFPGLVPLIKQYLDSADVDVDTRCTISQYLRFIQLRSTGEVWTLARWMREFVANHPEYGKDSKITDGIAYDLLKHMDAIAKGDKHCEKLLGSFRSKTDQQISAAVRKAEESLAMNTAARKSAPPATSTTTTTTMSNNGEGDTIDRHA